MNDEELKDNDVGNAIVVDNLETVGSLKRVSQIKRRFECIINSSSISSIDKDIRKPRSWSSSALTLPSISQSNQIPRTSAKYPPPLVFPKMKSNKETDTTKKLNGGSQDYVDNFVIPKSRLRAATVDPVLISDSDLNNHQNSYSLKSKNKPFTLDSHLPDQSFDKIKNPIKLSQSISVLEIPQSNKLSHEEKKSENISERNHMDVKTDKVPTLFIEQVTDLDFEAPDDSDVKLQNESDYIRLSNDKENTESTLEPITDLDNLDDNSQLNNEYNVSHLSLPFNIKEDRDKLFEIFPSPDEVNDTVESQPWFFRGERQESKLLLKSSKRNGTFFVRPGSQSKYILSIFVNGFVKNLKVREKKHNQWIIGDEKDEINFEVFPSVQTLIENYMKNGFNVEGIQKPVHLLLWTSE